MKAVPNTLRFTLAMSLFVTVQPHWTEDFVNVCSNLVMSRDCPSQPCPEQCYQERCELVWSLCPECLLIVEDCIECPEHYYGENCTESCSTNCVQGICHWNTGKCIACPPGRNGTFCELECLFPWYGPVCDYKCDSACLNCHHITGICTECEPGKMGVWCHQDACPVDFCMHGGTCSGISLCDCTSTDYYGHRCQYTRQDIPMTKYEFLDVVNTTVITTSGNMNAVGEVASSWKGSDVSIAIPAGSYVTTEEPTIACFNSKDDCESGFTLTVTHSFSSLSSLQTQVVLTTGAGLESDVETPTTGVSLYYTPGYVQCCVITSTKQWSISHPFELVANKSYEMTVSWHLHEGLVLLQGNNLITWSAHSVPLDKEAEVSNSLMIGFHNFRSSATVLEVKTLITTPIFWEELKRSGLMFATKTSSLTWGETMGIIIGCLLGFLISVTAIVARNVYMKRNRKEEQTEDCNEGDHAATQSALEYGINTVFEFENSNKAASKDDPASSTYGCIKDTNRNPEP